MINSIKPADPETPESQINRLADFIMHEVPGEPSRSEGAVDTAIRIIRLLLPSRSEVYTDDEHATITGKITLSLVQLRDFKWGANVIVSEELDRLRAKILDAFETSGYNE